MKKQNIFLIILVILIFLTGYFYKTKLQPNKNISIKQNVVLLKVGDEKNFTTYKTIEKKSALDLLKEKNKVTTKGEGVNAYVISINGIEAKTENKEFWSFYVNGKMAEVGAGSYIIREGDKIEWKIEKY
ncbi:MAG: hypothetical protein UR68_C0005G0008 [Candidatus Roizmanbacteria bacterium GW2011_GWA2_35_19]|uniref:Transcobalamin-like C-terminal domain-containing protein n=2 Tax=Candidatus Roizmaniibacteriota TaxID=1752723 RepID=A0A0G0BVA4_9BACT|nr:MAG: hypothetical protein UR63_C0028G0008 [Candidatus Roizmanbacteria bacterium GW2011_GWC2_35_12]KKP73274.1 MAG: hypothetical protein UR68_C0005G0008 [Candidatus Roizmanbacteria bacterium GW2011_GWA2_35_19]